MELPLPIQTLGVSCVIAGGWQTVTSVAVLSVESQPVARTQYAVSAVGETVSDALVAPAMGVLVSPGSPVYHCSVEVTSVATVSVVDWPALMARVAGGGVVKVGMQTVRVRP